MNWIENEAIKIEKKIIAHHRYLHKNAECGFLLEKTYNYVFNVLKELGCQPRKCGTMGIATKISGNGAKYAFAPYSLSINLDEKNEQEITKPQEKDRRFSILLRADMDALPMKEKTSLPYKSETECMHSCGHDMHTAMLLGTAKALYAMREKIGCRVKLLFQPSEEGIRSGAEEMVNHGVMDDIDVIIGLHIENWLESGEIGVCQGASMASSRNIKLEFFGRTAHATLPQTGHDALAAAVSTYNGIQTMLGNA